MRPQELDDLVVNWSMSGADCGLGGEPQPSAEQIMASVQPSERAAAIHGVLLRIPLSAPQQQRLLELLGASQDPRAMRSMTELWPQIPALLDRYNREVYEPEMAASGYPYRVSGSDRANLLGHIRVGALRGTAQIREPAALSLLMEGLSDSDPSVRAEAIVLLAGRPDFNDRARLLAARESLTPAQRPLVDPALAIEP